MNLRKLAVASVAGLLATSAVAAQDISERTIKVGIGLNEDHPQAQSVEKFGELLDQKSGGKIKVKLFAGGTLGNDVTMISALQGGTLEMTVPDTSTLVNIAGLEPFGLINLPFVLQQGRAGRCAAGWAVRAEAAGQAAGQAAGRAWPSGRTASAR